MRPRRLGVGLLSLLLALPGPVAADGLDSDVDEPRAGGAVGFVQDKRDGVLGLVENVVDLQMALVAEVTLLASSALMLVSDGVGLVDDNPLTQHVTRSVLSEPLAKTAYLLHVVGSETVLGSHGLDAEWYAEDALGQVNPLLDPDDAGPELPLEPLDFVGEGMLHVRPLTVRVPGALLASAAVADAAVRPAGNLLLFLDLRRPAAALDDAGTGLVRGTVP